MEGIHLRSHYDAGVHSPKVTTLDKSTSEVSGFFFWVIIEKWLSIIVQDLFF